MARAKMAEGFSFCYGMQAMGYLMGGHVVPASGPRGELRGLELEGLRMLWERAHPGASV